MLFLGISILVAVVFAVISVIFGLVSLAIPFILQALIAYWIYKDAEKHTDSPILWTIIVIWVPYCIGLIIYLLVGRRQRNSYY